MFKKTLAHRVISFFLAILFVNLLLGSANIYCQQQNETTNQEQSKTQGETKPKIIFKNQEPDSTQKIPSQDTTKSKIIFKKSYLLKENELRLISSKKFEFHGEEKMVGARGEFLIQAMGSNQRAVNMVNDAYKAKENGKLLMALGVVAAIVALVTIPTVELGESESGGYVTTYYWLPFITIGGIIGGIGYSKYNSLEKKLDEAVKTYNEDLVIEK